MLKYAEDKEDSVEILQALHSQRKFKNKLVARYETQPVESETGEDAADDPAIWVCDTDWSKSRVLGTNKTAGVYVYDLKGNILQYRKVGRINNIDLRDGFEFMNEEVVLVAGSNRSNNCISLFYIDKQTGDLSDTIANIRSYVDEVYGICLYHNQSDDEFFVFVNGKGGRIEQWLITGGDKVQASYIRYFNVKSQPEGMVACDINEKLFLGVEDAGIYQVDAESDAETRIELIPGSDSLNSDIEYDIEGLALFTYKGQDYLIASSQGNYSYAVFTLGERENYYTNFVIAGSAIDGVEETDGLEITTASLGPEFPEGLLVVQDGFNFDGDSLINQNFKYISVEQLLKFL
jgi:3-phytase